MDTRINIFELARVVRRLAAENPDTKYIKPAPTAASVAAATGCFYSKGDCTNGSHGCIIGQGLQELGLSKKALQDCDSKGSVRYLVREQYKIFSGHDGTQEQAKEFESTVQWLQSLQGAQDIQQTWGAALIAANTMLPEVVEILEKV